MIDVAKLTESDLWRTITDCAAELLARDDKMVVPLLRTRGERGAMEADLVVRVHDSRECGPVLSVENRTFEDAHNDPLRAQVSISKELFQRVEENHKAEEWLIQKVLGPRRHKLLQDCEELLQQHGGLVSFLRYKDSEAGLYLRKFLAGENVESCLADSRGVRGRGN